MGLRSKSLFGFLWTALGSAGNGLFNFIITVILARLLTPHDFALIEIVTVFILIANIFVESGFSQAIIREKDVSQKDLSSVFYFSVTLSFLLYLLLYGLSPFIASFFHEPKLTLLSKCAFVVIVINSFSIVHVAILNRSLEFKKLSISSLIAVLLSGIIAIVYALMVGGIWALLVNIILYPLFRIVFLSLFSKWHPTLLFSWKSIGKFFVFSSFLLVVEIIDMVITHSISFVIGKSYSKNELGFYSQGKKIDNFIITPVVGAVSRVIYPIISTIKDDNVRFIEGFNTCIMIMAFVLWPLAFFEIITADNLSLFLFGPKWKGTGFFLALFAVFGLFYPIQSICINVLLTKGKSKKYMYLSVVRQMLRVASLIVFFNKGVKVMATAFVLSGTVGSIIIIIFGFMEVGLKNVRFRPLMQLFLPLTGSLCAVGLLNVFLSEIVSIHILFIFQMIFMAISYLGLSFFLKVDALYEIVRIIMNEFPRLKSIYLQISLND